MGRERRGSTKIVEIDCAGRTCGPQGQAGRVCWVVAASQPPFALSSSGAAYRRVEVRVVRAPQRPILRYTALTGGTQDERGLGSGARAMEPEVVVKAGAGTEEKMSWPAFASANSPQIPRHTPPRARTPRPTVNIGKIRRNLTFFTWALGGISV